MHSGSSKTIMFSVLVELFLILNTNACLFSFRLMPLKKWGMCCHGGLCITEVQRAV